MQQTARSLPRLLVALAAVISAIALGVTARAAQTCLEGAGGTAVAHRGGGVPEAAGGAPTMRLCRVGLDAAEPTLGLASDGTIYYIASPTNIDISVMRSSDEGVTWTDVAPVFAGPVRRHNVDLDPYLYVDKATDRVFFLDLYVVCSEMSFTDDGGQDWTTNAATCGRVLNDHPTIFAGPPVTSTTEGYANVVYYCFQDIAVSATCSKSLDGGVTFLPQAGIAFEALAGPDCSAIHGHGVAGSDGTIYLPKADYCGLPTVAISQDEGASWSRFAVANTTDAPDHEASVAVDESGNIYYVWIQKDRLPYLTVSTDGGANWSTPIMVAPPGVNETDLPSIDVGAPGKVAIAYYGTSNSPGGTFQGSYTNTTWNGYMTITTGALSSTPLFFSAPLNDPSDPFHRGRCGPGRCGAVFDFIDVVVGPNGTAYSSFVDTCVGGCKTGGSNDGAAGVMGNLVGGPSLN